MSTFLILAASEKIAEQGPRPRVGPLKGEGDGKEGLEDNRAETPSSRADPVLRPPALLHASQGLYWGFSRGSNAT